MNVCPTIIRKNRQYLEFPKYHIVNSPASSGNVWRAETKLLGGVRGDTTQSLSRRVYPYNFVGQILKIFECLRLKRNSGGKLFRKLVKHAMSGHPPPPPPHSPTLLGKEILISDWNVRPSGTTAETPFWLGKTSSPPSRNTEVSPQRKCRHY